MATIEALTAEQIIYLRSGFDYFGDEPIFESDAQMRQAWAWHGAELRKRWRKQRGRQFRSFAEKQFGVKTHG